jgi:perosamine synthetase
MGQLFPVPVNEPLLDGNEKRYLVECIEGGWISSEGLFVARFEESFAAKVSRKLGIAVSSGSAALEVAVAALGIGPVDEVILPTFTIISCASAIVHAGAVPVLVDCDPHAWNMDVSQVEARVTPRTRAIMVVHLYGLPVDMDPVLEIANKYGLKVIEDAAEMHGQAYRDRPCGSFGEISTFSFYANKLVTTGEGGMILTDDDRLAERCRSLRDLGFQPRKRFVHEELGWNFRMSNLQAAVGLAQLERLDEFVARKRRMGERYTALLEGMPALQLPIRNASYANNIYWAYGVVLGEEFGFNAEEARTLLAQHKIGTRPFFWPMHEQPVFRRMGLFKGEAYPNAEYIARRGLYLPSGLALTDEQIDYVAQTVRKALW